MLCNDRGENGPYQSNETRRKRRRVQSGQQKTPTPTGTHENGVNFVNNAPNRTFASVASTYTCTTDMPAAKVRKAPCTDYREITTCR